MAKTCVRGASYRVLDHELRILGEVLVQPAIYIYIYIATIFLAYVNRYDLSIAYNLSLESQEIVGAKNILV